MQPKPTKGVAIFEQRGIRRIWHDERWWFSVIDVVGVLTGCKNPRTYWAVMKGRIKSADFVAAISNCVQIKMAASDNKLRLTECADIRNIIPILHAIPPAQRRPREDKMSERSGIYAIVNLLTGERYIGSSIDVDTRFAQHQMLLRRKKHHAVRLQAAWDQYGEEAFKMAFLEEIAEEADLEIIEQVYLDQEHPEYNSSQIASNNIAFPNVEDVRIHQLLEALRYSAGEPQDNSVMQDIQLAIDFGIITPGPKFHLLIEAEVAGIETWDALKAFLINK